MAESVEAFLTDLSRYGRVLLLGGLAVIGHGLQRATKDANVWLFPFASLEEWAEILAQTSQG